MKEAAPACGVPSLYCAIDRHRRGWFSLKDWHEDSWALLAGFRRWASSQFSKASDCFKAWDDKSGINLGEFRRHCKELSASYEEKEYLFEGLSLEGEVWSEEKGRWAHGKLTRNEIIFLDTWDPDEEVTQAQAADEVLRKLSEDREGE